MATTPVFFPGEPHGRRSLVGHTQSTGSQRVSHDRATSLSLFLSLQPSLSIFAVPSSFPSLTAKRSQNRALGPLEKYYCFFSISLQSSFSFLLHPFFLFFKTPDPANHSQAWAGGGGRLDQPEWAPPPPRGSVRRPRQTHRQPHWPLEARLASAPLAPRKASCSHTLQNNPKTLCCLRVVPPGKEKKV